MRLNTRPERVPELILSGNTAPPPQKKNPTSPHCAHREFCIYYCKISANRNFAARTRAKTGAFRLECTKQAASFWPKCALFRKLFLFLSSGTNIKQTILWYKYLPQKQFLVSFPTLLLNLPQTLFFFFSSYVAPKSRPLTTLLLEKIVAFSFSRYSPQYIGTENSLLCSEPTW
jgi:hypothetical protein